MKKVDHYLLSLGIGPVQMHAYLISNDKHDIERCMNCMQDHAEDIAKKCGISLLNIVLITGPLTRKTWGKIEDYLCSQNDEVAGKLKSYEKFHVTMWCIANDHPKNKELMEIH